MIYISDWIAVERNVFIPWDLEGTPLQIKTNSTLGSGDRIRGNMYDKGGSNIGYVRVEFSSTVQYYIGSCSNSWADLPVQPPVEVDKIWTITKTETAIIITCNNVEVLNYLLADSSNSNCVTNWGGDVVEKIKFSSDWDTASDFYRAGESLNLTYHIISTSCCIESVYKLTIVSFWVLRAYAANIMLKLGCLHWFI